jgi:drug/metabolite transporter (DMT)-like permease
VGQTALGVVIMLVGTSALNAGVVLQKRVVDRLPAFEAVPLRETIRALLRAPLWVAGWLVGLVGFALNIVALGLADIGLVQPLNGFGLVVLALLSRFFLGERLDGRALSGMALVIGGVVLVGMVLPESQEFPDSAALLACYPRPAALLTVAGLLAAVGLGYGVARALPRAAGIPIALAAACCSVAGLTFSKGFTGAIALDGLAAFVAWPTWALLALLFVLSSGAMALQQLSLQKGRAVEVTPAFSAASVVLPLLPGRWVFHETLPDLALVSALLITAGVILLGARRAGEGA